MNATIKDVAKLSGCSITSVSLVLNGKYNRISEAKRSAIRAAAAALHYVPNQLAVSLVTKKTNTLGLIIPDIHNFFFSELAKHAELEAAKYDNSIIFASTMDAGQNDLKYLKLFMTRGYDGIIYAPSSKLSVEERAACVDLIATSPVPVVLVDRELPEAKAPIISLDHHLGGYLATRHLLDLGHEKIGCVTGPQCLLNTQQRIAGYRQALTEAGLPCDDTLLFEGDFQIESGRQAVPELLGRAVSAIFCFNDMMAFGACKALREYRVVVPEKMSVIGFDDTFMAELLDVPLTTVYQPVAEFGVSAVQTLQQMIQAPGEAFSDTRFQPVLKVRASTGKA